jgi:hypothetical protein
LKSGKRKVLIVTSSFYPDPHVGAVRVKEFARWLPENGWAPVILAKDYGHRVCEQQFLAHVGPHVEVLYLNKHVHVDSPTHIERGGPKVLLGRFLDRYVVAPDSSLLYWISARRSIMRLIAQTKPAVVVTSGPPHSIHAVGIWLKREFPRVPWVADFRDVFRVAATTTRV